MSKHPPHTHRPSGRGFSLIELMIGIAVLGIISALAYPNFMDSVRKSRRSEAIAALAAVQQAQERWRANHTEYSLDAANELNVPDPERYTLALSSTTGSTTVADANGYTATATGRKGQDKDSQCSLIGVRLVNGNLTYAGCGGASCTLTYATTNTCWNR